MNCTLGKSRSSRGMRPIRGDGQGNSGAQDGPGKVCVDPALPFSVQRVGERLEGRVGDVGHEDADGPESFKRFAHSTCRWFGIVHVSKKPYRDSTPGANACHRLVDSFFGRRGGDAGTVGCETPGNSPPDSMSDGGDDRSLVLLSDPSSPSVVWKQRHS